MAMRLRAQYNCMALGCTPTLAGSNDGTVGHHMSMKLLGSALIRPVRHGGVVATGRPHRVWVVVNRCYTVRG
ncbi:hypothetical protein GUJ93_ZPchr0001g31579 [Zizania palustris]|uniref:Uncharacterized protein n=1 Tax=Zizania palustris TaxID=103762 RepID=A0A8J5RN72_ZIZPA|nr:hypothetical protein GUJ93_ZPchr0001g31579 [Zizania palustris]